MKKKKTDHSDHNELKLKEYELLNNEHTKNRSLMFERPLLIITVLTAILTFDVLDKYYFILPVILIIPILNLKFTTNRLESDARIIAYTLLFHEGQLKNKWIGWEKSLFKYRLLMKNTRNIKIRIRENFRTDNQAGRFYKIIWFIHLIIVFAILMIMLSKVCVVNNGYSNICLELKGSNIYYFISFSISVMFWCIYQLFYKNFPYRFNNIITIELARWMEVVKLDNWYSDFKTKNLYVLRKKKRFLFW